MKRFALGILTVVLLWAPQQTEAQIEIPDTIPGKGFFVGQLNLAKHIMDFFLDKRDASNAAKLDSNYIGYYPEKLMFSTGLAQTGGWLIIKDDNSSYNLESDVSRVLNLRACYRGLAMSFSVNPFNVFGNTDTEFDISFYGDKLVFDFMYQNSNTLKGTFTSNGSFDGSSTTQQTDLSVDKGFINRRTTMLGAMYVFNSRRFSYSAVFDQTCIQKRSCGSILLGANYLYNRMRLDLGGLGNFYFRNKMLGIGGGYGYNLVLPRQWLISTSALLEAGVWSYNSLEVSQEFANLLIESMKEEGKEIPTEYNLEEKYSYDGIPLIVIPRLAVIHHFGHFFAGFTSLGTFHYERSEGQNNYHFIFTSNLLFGIRL